MLYDMKEDNAPKEFQTCSRSSEIGEKTLRREENWWGKRRRQSWGDESTKEFQDSTKEPIDCQWGSWVTLTVKLEKRRVKKGEVVSSVQVYEPVKIG
jgi:hypothetical protein